MWWILAIGFGLAVAILVGKCIQFGTGDWDEDYMMGDDDSDRGDKS